MARLGAQCLCDICSPVSPADAKPGDLVFFEHTYDTGSVSHVGIYVGNGMMLAAGNSIGYSNLSTSYWQSHFYTFGRLPNRYQIGDQSHDRYRNLIIIPKADKPAQWHTGLFWISRYVKIYSILQFSFHGTEGELI